MTIDLSTDLTTDITATLTVTDDGDQCGEQYQSAYEIALYADGRQIGRVGDVVAPVSGWAIGAWLAPGAHADINGSGLALWGDSQPGGWTTAHDDGATTGRPRVANGPYDSAEGGDPIIVMGGEGMLDIEIAPADIPEWSAAVAELDRLTAANEADPDDEAIEDAWDAADSATYEIRSAIAEAIEDAIDRVVYEGMPAEPTADDVLAQLNGEEQDGLEWGNYQGAGPVIAWRDADGLAQFRWWPNADEIREAVDATVAPAVAERIARDLRDEA